MFKRKRCSVCGKKLELWSVEAKTGQCREHVVEAYNKLRQQKLDSQKKKTVEERLTELEEFILKKM